MNEVLDRQAVSKKPNSAFRVIRGITKLVAIFLGLPLTIVSFMSVIGLLSDNLWIRLIPAVIVTLGAPLVLVDRLLPDDDQQTVQGLASDVLAVIWLGFGVVFIGLAHPITNGLLVAEADRYATSGSEFLAQATYWMAGVTPIAPAPSQSSNETSGGIASTEDADAGAADAGTTAASANDGSPATQIAGDGDLAESDALDASEGSDEAPLDSGVKTYTPAELFRKVSPAVVTISVKGSNPLEEGSGTGFIIDNNGTIATNQHVIRNATSVGVKLIGSQYPDGHRWIHEVALLVEDADVDLALLQVPPVEEVEPLVLGDSDDATVGENVICIGNPLGLEHTLSDGLISSRRVHKGRQWVQMTAPISPGNSGGPVIAMNGLVVGIATATVNRVFGGSAQNLNLAVPVNALKAMIRDNYPDRRQFEVAPGGSSTW